MSYLTEQRFGKGAATNTNKMQLSAARALLLALHWVASVSASAPSSCAKYGEFEGSEDSTLWKAGLAFQSSGLEIAPGKRLPVGHQGGE